MPLLKNGNDAMRASHQNITSVREIRRLAAVLLADDFPLDALARHLLMIGSLGGFLTLPLGGRGSTFFQVL
jgi:hypothetical protein